MADFSCRPAMKRALPDRRATMPACFAYESRRIEQ
jgi:hypothetical protein